MWTFKNFQLSKRYVCFKVIFRQFQVFKWSGGVVKKIMDFFPLFVTFLRPSLSLRFPYIKKNYFQIIWFGSEGKGYMFQAMLVCLSEYMYQDLFTLFWSSSAPAHSPRSSPRSSCTSSPSPSPSSSSSQSFIFAGKGARQVPFHQIFYLAMSCLNQIETVS